MAYPHRPSSLKRSGLTLVELVVVMFILMALAAITIPLFPTMIERAHRSSQVTSMQELNKAVQMYQAINGFYPNGYDLLTDGTTIVNYFPAVPAGQGPVMMFGDAAGTMGSNVYNLGYTSPAGGLVTTGPLSANAQAALNGAGITFGYAMVNNATLGNDGGTGTAATAANGTGATQGPNAFQPTFNPYPGGAPLTQAILTAGTTQVVYVNPTGVYIAGLGNPSSFQPAGKATGQQFVMFGVGRGCTMVGNTIANPGSNFPNDAVHENPNIVYQRFGVIFQVEDAGGLPLPAAVFLGAVAIESNILLGVDGTMESFSQNIPQISAPAAGPGN